MEKGSRAEAQRAQRRSCFWTPCAEWEVWEAWEVWGEGFPLPGAFRLRGGVSGVPALSFCLVAYLAILLRVYSLIAGCQGEFNRKERIERKIRAESLNAEICIAARRRRRLKK